MMWRKSCYYYHQIGVTYLLKYLAVTVCFGFKHIFKHEIHNKTQIENPNFPGKYHEYFVFTCMTNQIILVFFVVIHNQMVTYLTPN